MTTTTSKPMIILIAGYWLGAWAWDDVLKYLDTNHLHVIPMTLPGRDGDDPERSAKTLEDQATAVIDVINRSSTGQSVIIAAHSGANAPVSLVLDRHPELVHRMVWVDSGPVSPGNVPVPDFPEGVEELPLPSFEDLKQQASLEGLSAEVLERFRARAVPEPGPALRQSVELAHTARRQIHTTMVCCSILSTQVRDMVRRGHPMFAEVAHLKHLDMVDLPTGHWPMWSRPRDLAQVISSAASASS